MAMNRFATKLLLVALAGFLLPVSLVAAKAAKVAIDPAGRAYDLSGKLKGKVLDRRVRGSGSGSLRFGPDWDLAAGEFALPLNDGWTVIDVAGTYAHDAKGKLVFTPDTRALEEELKDLFEDSFDIYFDAEVPGARWSLDVTKAKLKITFRSKKGVESAKARLKFTFVTTGEAGGKRKSAKATISYKAGGPRAD